ncbi:MAG: cation:proton antiporter [Lentisphaeria bacterium]|nr:cation:proton antiporter [Lentisphaeria bacterium]
MLNFHLSVVQQIAILALQLGVIIFAAKFCGDFAKKLKMPSVLGELCAGIIIGPYVLGGIGIPLHGLENGLFAISSAVTVEGIEGTKAILEGITFQQYHSSLYAIATIGSILLLFMSGLETDLRMFFRYSLVGTVVGIGGVIFSYGLGAAIGVYLMGLTWMHPVSMFLGILCTATSVGITARILSEKKKVDTPEGVTILAAAVIDDVLGIICLAVVLGIVGASSSGGTIDWAQIGIISAKCVGFWLAATAIGLLLARYIAKFLKIFKSPIIFASLSFGLALILAGIFEQNGLAMIIGAYVMGLSLSKTDISFAIQTALEPLSAFFVPVFFVVMGMLVDIRVFADSEVLKLGVIYSLLAIAAKVIGCALPSLFMNFRMIGALRIGCGMIPRGEVALIIAGIGMSTMYMGAPILDEKIFGVAIIMTLATTLFAPPLLSFTLSVGGKGTRKDEKDMSVVHTSFPFPSVMVTDFVLRRLIENLESEGYMLSHLDKDSGVLQIRKDNLSFALTKSPKEFVFESNPDEVPFIRAIMFESIVALHQDLEGLKKLANPEDIRKDYFDPSAEVYAPENSKQIRSMIEKGLSLNSIIMDLKANTKEAVIKEMICRLAGNGLLLDKDLCEKDVLEREAIVSTCFQNGIALPHGRTDGVKELVAAVGINRNGYNFDAIDGKPSKIFVMCLSPKNSDGPHIEFVATVGSVLAKQENIDSILSAKTPEEVFAILDIKK